MSFFDRPSARELIDAVRDFLAHEIAPNEPNRKRRFHAIVAANALAIARRELDAVAAQDRDDERLAELGARDRRALCDAIRAGDYDAPDDWAKVVTYARAHVAEKLAVDNPRFLERFATIP